MAAPAWASELIEAVLNEEGFVERPVVIWRRAGAPISRYRDSGSWFVAGSNLRPDLSSGRYYPTKHRLVITAGRRREDQRLALLHELAHLIRCEANPKARHDDGFWRIAWRLFSRHGVSPSYALKRSADYRVGALRIAAELSIRGAKKMLAERQQTSLKAARSRAAEELAA